MGMRHLLTVYRYKLRLTGSLLGLLLLLVGSLLDFLGLGFLILDGLLTLFLSSSLFVSSGFLLLLRG